MKEFHSEVSGDFATEGDNTKSEKDEKNIDIEDNTPVDINQKRNFGNTYPLLFYKGEPLIVLGPDWRYLLLIYPSALIIFSLLFTMKIKPKLHIAYQIVSALLFCFFTFSYFMLALKNQGIPPFPTTKSPEELKNYRQCSICHCIINLESELITFHCAECDICVENFNHHCPYATKCIANGNSLYFYLFLISTPVLIIGEIVFLLV